MVILRFRAGHAQTCETRSGSGINTEINKKKLLHTLSVGLCVTDVHLIKWSEEGKKLLDRSLVVSLSPGHYV